MRSPVDSVAISSAADDALDVRSLDVRFDAQVREEANRALERGALMALALAMVPVKGRAASVEIYAVGEERA